LADIFISYARADRDKVEKLARALEGEDYSVWWDRNIGGGAEFSAVIEKELGAAKTVIVVWSAHSLSSHWVRDEADHARGEGKLLPLSLDGAAPPLGFRQIHALDFSSWDETTAHSAFRELMRSMGGEAGASPASAPSSVPSSAHTNSKITKPGLAVLPFNNMSTDEEVEFLADGLTEDIITTLSFNRHISVAARTSTFAYKGQSADIREVGKALGVRYVVEGSVRKMGKRVRVTVQFIEAETGAHIWAKKFDQLLDDLYETSDDLVEKITGGLFPQLVSAEVDRSEKALPESLGPWEYCQQAAQTIARGGGTVKGDSRVFAELGEAVRLAPDYALPHAILSWAYNAAIINGTYEDDELVDYITRAKAHLRKAREFAQDDLLCLTYIGAAENFAGMQERSLYTLESVLARNPANAEAWYIICQTYAYLGRFEDARNAIDRACALAPEAGYAPIHEWYRALTDFLAGDLGAAVPLIERHILHQPEYGYVSVIAAICATAFGDDAGARRHIARAKEHNPQLRPEKLKGMMLSQPDKEKGKREYAILERLWAEDAD